MMLCPSCSCISRALIQLDRAPNLLILPLSLVLLHLFVRSLCWPSSFQWVPLPHHLHMMTPQLWLDPDTLANLTAVQ
jgi:hypothetical protein